MSMPSGEMSGLPVRLSLRHVVDNVKKAESVGVRLWVVVPSRRLCRLVERKLGAIEGD